MSLLNFDILNAPDKQHVDSLRENCERLDSQAFMNAIAFLVLTALAAFVFILIRYQFYDLSGKETSFSLAALCVIVFSSVATTKVGTIACILPLGYAVITTAWVDKLFYGIDADVAVMGGCLGLAFVMCFDFFIMMEKVKQARVRTELKDVSTELGNLIDDVHFACLNNHNCRIYVERVALLGRPLIAGEIVGLIDHFKENDSRHSEVIKADRYRPLLETLRKADF